MSWGPDDNFDMWTKKKESFVQDDLAVLAYGPNVNLIVEFYDELWHWREKGGDRKNR